MKTDKKLYSIVSMALIFLFFGLMSASVTHAETYTFVANWGSRGISDGQFKTPIGIDVDSSDNVYIADVGNHRIQKFDSNGNFITNWGSEGTGNGQFYGANGIGVDVSDNIYVVESGNNRIQKFDSNGNFITKWGSEGTGNGQFKYPYDVAVDSLGNAYITDTENQRVQKFSKEKITPTIVWSNPADIISGTPLSNTQLNAVATDPVTGAPVDGTFTYDPAAGNVLAVGNSQNLYAAFTPSDPATYNSGSADVAINVLKVTPTITWRNPADIMAGTALSGIQLNAVASVPGTFVYTPGAGIKLSAGTQSLYVDFTPTDTANYNTTSKDVTINVLTPVQKIQQIITMVKSLNLNTGQSNELIVKLNAAVKNLNSGKTNEAINELNSFINEVKGYINSGILSSTQGQSLIDEVNSVINSIKK